LSKADESVINKIEADATMVIEASLFFDVSKFTAWFLGLKY